MQKAVLLIILSHFLFLTLWAQEPTWTVVTAAVGSSQETVRASNDFLNRVQTELDKSGKVHIAGQRLSGFRPQTTNENVLDYGAELKADGVAVVEFVPTENEARGNLYLWTAKPSGKKTEFTKFVEAVNLKRPEALQVSRVAAIIEQTVSEGREVAVEIHIYTRPPRSYFKIGGSIPGITDEPGRTADEGQKMWIGTQPAGPTTIEVYKPTAYEGQTRTILVQARTDNQPSMYIEDFKLKKRREK